MSTDLNNEQIMNTEVDFKDFFSALWKQKTIIICITLICAILTGIFSIFVLPTVYQSKLNIIISMPEKYNSKFGDYKLPITSNQQYIDLLKSNKVLMNTKQDMGKAAKNLTIEDLRDSITIGEIATSPDVIQNSFHVTVSADSPKKALLLANSLYDNYIEYLDVMTKERAVAYYYDKLSSDILILQETLATEKEILKKNEELLAETSQTINQKGAMQELLNHNNESDFVVLENIINPNYTKIENDIIVNKQEINANEKTLQNYTKYVKELNIEKEKIIAFNESSSNTEFSSSMVSLINSNIYLSSSPVEPTRKTSPSNLMNTIIGIFVGGVLGVLIALIKNYGLKKQDVK